MSEVLSERDLCESLTPEFSDDWLAVGFAEGHKDRLRYTAERSRWQQWKEKTHWDQDRTLLGLDLVRDHCRRVVTEMGDDDETKTLRHRLSSGKTIAAVERLARADRRMAALPEQWDRDPWLLNTPEGTIHLQNGKAKENDPADFITRITAVAPAPAGSASPKMWTTFLDGITGGDQELQGFLQRVYGYSLTADVREEALFFFYGAGFNGKSTFVNTIAGAIGSYDKPALDDSFMSHSHPQHSCDIADLAGARLVTAVETSEGTFWDEAKIKSLTGRDPQKGRFMRCNPTEFMPTQKFLIMGNHKPRLRVVDKAIQGRLHIVPFDASFPPDSPDRIKNLEEKLRPHWPYVLRWGINGCLEWAGARVGLLKAVIEASAEYFEGEDVLGRWISECCELKSSAFTATHRLSLNFKNWAGQVNESVNWSERKLSDELETAEPAP